MKKTIIWLLTAVILTTSGCGAKKASDNSIPCWTEDSAAAKSIMAYVDEVVDETSYNFVPVESRIAVFDFDGTLYGERFPASFETCLMMYRTLHDVKYEAPEEIKAYAAELEEALMNYQPAPDSGLSASRCSAEIFKGVSYWKYREYIREYMSNPAYGFKGMTYREGFYKPMVELIKYLADHDFTIFISSGSERTVVRELTWGYLDDWIPFDRVIGNSFSFISTGQHQDTDSREYRLAENDGIEIEGYMQWDNRNTNKVLTVIDEIGTPPVLVFGNSSEDLALAEYSVQYGGKAYMLLCDDTERDYGDPDAAAEFAGECEKLGFETVSMKNDFSTIYGDHVEKIEEHYGN